MGRILVPLTMTAAMVAFAVAALSVGLMAYQSPAWWPAAVQLAVLGGILPMIYAVNIRIVPVFSRRSWSGEGWLNLQAACAIAGAWTVFGSRIAAWESGLVLGHGLALAGGITFIVNLARLFRQPVGRAPAPPLPYEGQAAIDILATRFTRLSGIYLLIGLTIGFMTTWWRPTTGRWDLVWAHALLIGFFLSMAAGVCYHVLARWTARRWRWVWAVRLHFMVVAAGLPFMLLALATDWMPLFAIAGPLQAAAVALFLVNVAPMLGGLPMGTRAPVAVAGAFLVTGVGLGAAFAVEPVIGARLRLAHAELNLFGWAGLLICGVGYYLIPRFLGRPLRWPRLVPLQLGSLITGVLVGSAALWWNAYGDGSRELLLVAQSLVALGFGLYGVHIAVTFGGRQARGVTAPVMLRPQVRQSRPA